MFAKNVTRKCSTLSSISGVSTPIATRMISSFRVNLGSLTKHVGFNFLANKTGFHFARLEPLKRSHALWRNFEEKSGLVKEGEQIRKRGERTKPELELNRGAV